MTTLHNIYTSKCIKGMEEEKYILVIIFQTYRVNLEYSKRKKNEVDGQ